jgi:hypothetical protein
MKASIVDLRYKMNDILKALNRNETVTVLYRGKIKGVIIPVNKVKSKKVREHPFFGMTKKKDKSVSEEIEELRGTRYHVV